MPTSQLSETPNKADYRVADISVADFGRREINLAEVEMPGLMALRQEYAGQRPLAGAVSVVHST